MEAFSDCKTSAVVLTRCEASACEAMSADLLNSTALGGTTDRTPLARMLPRVMGGPAWDRGRVLMPGRIFAPAVPRQVRPVQDDRPDGTGQGEAKPATFQCHW